jgi:DNA-binding transcriptional ArsR family regulator
VASGTGVVEVAHLHNESELAEAARLFGVLAEPARLRILQILGDGSRCGRELAKDLNLTPATTCHHLEKLKTANLLSERRSGRHVYYSISKEDFSHAVRQSLAAFEHPQNDGKRVRKNTRKKTKRNDKGKHNHER